MDSDSGIRNRNVTTQCASAFAVKSSPISEKRFQTDNVSNREYQKLIASNTSADQLSSNITEIYDKNKNTTTAAQENCTESKNTTNTDTNCTNSTSTYNDYTCTDNDCVNTRTVFTSTRSDSTTRKDTSHTQNDTKSTRTDCATTKTDCTTNKTDPRTTQNDLKNDPLTYCNDTGKSFQAKCEKCRFQGLLHRRELPKHLQFNPYIDAGYRPLLSIWESLLSIFYLHNETVNIVTHGESVMR